MAASDETIDPNDLDSIDALLDEAELEVAEKKGGSGEEDQDAIDSLLDDVTLPEPVAESDQEVLDPEPEDDVLPELEADNESDLVQDDLIDVDDVDKKQPPIKKAVSEVDPPQISPEAEQPNPTKEMTAEDMDSIKKLIIIFGSALVVLALIGIGIGVWSVFAAKGSGLDDETKTMLESTQVSTERMAGKVIDSNESIHTIEKKIDALNFQLEELSSEFLALQSPVVSAKKQDIIDPLGLNVHTATATPKTASSMNMPMASSTVGHDNHSSSETAKLAGSVNKKMISAQRRIDEVNRRVKDIQSKHKALLLSIKRLEKQLVLQQKKMAVKEMKKKKESHNPYQYSAPDATYYDQSVGDSYP